MYTVTGNLASGTVAEGEDIPLSKYVQTKGPAYTVDLEEWRKATTAQAILKFGYESAFGFTYLRNFLSLGTCIFDAKVPRGTVYATLTENINCYAVDLSELARAGLDFEVSDETGLIGVHHTGRHQNGTAETYADTGLLLFPEVLNYIVRATIDPDPLDGVTVAPKAGTATMFGHRVSTLQGGVEVADGRITGTLKHVSTGSLAETWGPGHFLALAFSNRDADATSVKVGMEPTMGSGLVELDSDMDGVFKVSDKQSQQFVVLSSNAGQATKQAFDLSGLVLEQA